MNNTLIKRKKLILILKKSGITRISPKAIIVLENLLRENIENLIPSLKEKLIIKGKKTLESEDIKEI